MMNIADEIVSKAFELGYDGCGIINVEKMEDYAVKLRERIELFPETKSHLEKYYSFANPRADYPWANSIIICSRWYGKYSIPENIRNSIGKYYLTDRRREKRSRGYQDSNTFENYLNSQGIRTKTDRDFGVTALRWAALQAGIGTIRKNNFFYTEKGSWFYLEAFLIDKELEYIADHKIKECPENCSLCIDGCPTGSLAAPYMTNRSNCISCLTTWNGWDLITNKYSSKMSSWIYGCDICQDICPFNNNSWIDEEEFPSLAELSEKLSYEQIVSSDYDFLRNIIQPKLWYIPEEKIWRFKTNVLNAMLNCYNQDYLPLIQKACSDSDENVRGMARWVLSMLGNK